MVAQNRPLFINHALVYFNSQIERVAKNIYEINCKELRQANNSDLDSYLFGPLSIDYQGTGKNLLEPESKQVVLDYLKEVRYKYTIEGIKAAPKDTHRTAPYYFELIKYMGS